MSELTFSEQLNIKECLKQFFQESKAWHSCDLIAYRRFTRTAKKHFMSSATILNDALRDNRNNDNVLKVIFKLLSRRKFYPHDH